MSSPELHCLTGQLTKAIPKRLNVRMHMPKLSWKWRLPRLIFLHRKWRYPKTLLPVSSDPLLLRFTSFGIRASALDTGSILFFFFVICLGSCFCPCSVICVLVYILFRFCLRLVFCYLRSCSCHVLVLVSCVFHTVSRKNCKKNLKKKVVFWSLNTKLRHLELFFLKENRGTNPLI